MSCYIVESSHFIYNSLQYCACALYEGNVCISYDMLLAVGGSSTLGGLLTLKLLVGMYQHYFKGWALGLRT